MGIELQQLRQVVALAEHGSFVRAAAALYISQPALSRSIQNAERTVGSDLFVRGPGGVTPTDLGRVYIERARDLVRLADELDGSMRSARTLTGRVAVGGGPYPAESFLGMASARFVTDHPGTSVRLDASDWEDLLRRLRSRELDFFVAESSLLAREPDIEVSPLGSARAVYWVARSEHPLARHARVDAAEVLGYPLVTAAPLPPRLLEPMLALHAKAAIGSGAPRPLPAVLCNGLAPLKRIVASSDAVTGSILASVEAELESGRFVLLGTEPWLYLQYAVVALKGQPWTQAASTLLDYVREAEQQVDAKEALLLRRYGRNVSAARREPGRAATRRRRASARGDATP
jgi:DNA-binding transcriptional LysR family regulator